MAYKNDGYPNPSNRGRPLTTDISKTLGFSFNNRLWKNLKPLKMATINQDFDCAIIVDGNEGAGKSVFALQIAAAMDVDNIVDVEEQVCMTPDSFKKAVASLKKGKAVVWDEARRGVNRRRSTDKINIDITDMLAECRQKNLIMVIVMPTFYDMDMNVAVWRTRALVHVWYDWDDNPDKPLKRGFFRYYSEKGKKMLYTNKHWRQGYDYPLLTNKCFDGTFVHYYPCDEQKYREFKAKSIEDFKKQAVSGKPDCPSCGGSSTKFNRTKKVWYCAVCDWTGTNNGQGNTNKTNEEKV